MTTTKQTNTYLANSEELRFHIVLNPGTECNFLAVPVKGKTITASIINVMYGDPYMIDKNGTMGKTLSVTDRISFNTPEKYQEFDLSISNKSDLLKLATPTIKGWNFYTDNLHGCTNLELLHLCCRDMGNSSVLTEMTKLTELMISTSEFTFNPTDLPTKDDNNSSVNELKRFYVTAGDYTDDMKFCIDGFSAISKNLTNLELRGNYYHQLKGISGNLSVFADNNALTGLFRIDYTSIEGDVASLGNTSITNFQATDCYLYGDLTDLPGTCNRFLYSNNKADTYFSWKAYGRSSKKVGNAAPALLKIDNPIRIVGSDICNMLEDLCVCTGGDSRAYTIITDDTKSLLAKYSYENIIYDTLIAQGVSYLKINDNVFIEKGVKIEASTNETETA